MTAHPLGPFRPSNRGRPRRLAAAHSCRGGSTKRLPTGYVLEYSPDHPNAAPSGHVYQHRLVAECVLGRLLLRAEQVHHRNEVRDDNRPENLEVLTVAQHAQKHTAVRYHAPKRAISDEQVRAALDGRTIRAAAQHLNCSVVLLYDRFRHILPFRGRARAASSSARQP